MSARLCPQCSHSFEPNAKHHVYDTQECRYQAHVEREVLAAQASVQRVEVPSLDEVRARGEASKEKARFTLITREHITHTLLATGYFSAEDFDSLGVPPEHVNVCTSWIGNFSKRKFMEPISWRRSSKPSRKGGKVWTYKITEKGRDQLPALLEDTRREIAGVDGDGGVEPGRGSAAAGVSVHSGDAGLTGPGSGADGAETSQEPPGPEEAPAISTASPDQTLAGVSTGRPTPQGMEGLRKDQKPAGTHSGEKADVGVQTPQGPGAADPVAPCAGNGGSGGAVTSSEPAQLFSESSYEKLRDVA